MANSPTFEVVTDKIISGWKGGETPPQLWEIFETTLAQLPSTHERWQQMCYELCARVATEEIPVLFAAGFVASLKKLDATAMEAMADALWVLGLSATASEADSAAAASKKSSSSSTPSSPAWTCLVELVKQLCKPSVALPSDSSAATTLQAAATAAQPQASPFVPVFFRVLDGDMLSAAGLVATAEGFEKRLKKMNTDAVYRQQKYNLLREETEGYAKLVVLLGTLTPGGLSAGLTAMRSLIGFFDLDPNRVLSLVLEAYECDPGNDAFLAAVQQFKRAYLPHVLGFKFQFYSASTGAASPPAPGSLFRGAAQLLARGLVELESVLPHLHPSLQACASVDEARNEAFAACAEAVGKVNLNSGEGDTAVVIPSFERAGLLLSDAPPLSPSAGSPSSPHSSDAAAAATAAEDSPQGAAAAGTNQVFGVLEALVRMRAWKAVGGVVASLEANGCFGTFTHPPLRQALCQVVHALVDPVYTKHCCPKATQGIHMFTPGVAAGAGGAAQAGTSATDTAAATCTEEWRLGPARCLEDLEGVLEGPLRLLGCGLASDPVLFAKLCRLLKAMLLATQTNQGSQLPAPLDSSLSSALPALRAAATATTTATAVEATQADCGQLSDDSNQAAQLKAFACQALQVCVLPACSLLKCNPGLTLEVWGVLAGLPYHVRCGLYEFWLTGDLPTSSPTSTSSSTTQEVSGGLSGGKGPATRPRGLEVVVAEQEAGHAMKQLLKRISSDKKKLKQDARGVARLAHSNPLVVFDRMIANAVSYDNQIGPLVECVGFLTPFGLDVGSFMLVRFLRSGRQGQGNKSAKFEGSVSDWFRNVAAFIAAFYVAHPQVEMSGVLGYVAEQLSNGRTEELLILKELLARVGGCEVIEQVNEDCVLAFAGGECLLRECMHGGAGGPKKSVKLHFQRALLASSSSSLASESTPVNQTAVGVGGSSLALPLLLLTAQQRSVILFGPQSKDREMKLVGDEFDRAHLVLLQLVEFLGKSLTNKQKANKPPYASVLPSLGTLCTSNCTSSTGTVSHARPMFELHVAFTLARPLLRAAFDSAAAALPALPTPSNSAAGGAVTGGEAAAAMEDDAGAVSGGAVVSGGLGAWCVQSSLFQQDVAAALPSDVWEKMSMLFFTTFWGLELQDIHCPTELYALKCAELKKLGERHRKEVRDGQNRALPEEQKKVDDHRVQAKLCEKREKELSAELGPQQKNCEAKLKLLETLKEGFFNHLPVVTAYLDRKKDKSNGGGSGGESVSSGESNGKAAPGSGNSKEKPFVLIQQTLLQHCLLPRLFLTEEDALFCAKFTLWLHSAEVPAFSSLQCFDRIVKTVVPTVCCVTEREASNLGLFLYAFLEPLVKWLGSKKLYQREAESKPGFEVRPFSADTKKAEHKQFRAVFNSWHTKISDTLLKCLQPSSSKFEQRAGLNVLVKIVRLFPTFKAQHSLFVERLGQLSVKEGAGPPSDINTVAMNLKAQLEKRKGKDVLDDLTPPAAPVAAAPPPASVAAAAAAATTSPSSSSPSSGTLVSPLPASHSPSLSLTPQSCASTPIANTNTAAESVGAGGGSGGDGSKKPSSSSPTPAAVVSSSGKSSSSSKTKEGKNKEKEGGAGSSSSLPPTRKRERDEEKDNHGEKKQAPQQLSASSSTGSIKDKATEHKADGKVQGSNPSTSTAPLSSSSRDNAASGGGGGRKRDGPSGGSSGRDRSPPPSAGGLPATSKPRSSSRDNLSDLRGAERDSSSRGGGGGGGSGGSGGASDRLGERQQQDSKRFRAGDQTQTGGAQTAASDKGCVGSSDRGGGGGGGGHGPSRAGGAPAAPSTASGLEGGGGGGGKGSGRPPSGRGGGGRRGGGGSRR